MQYRERLYPSPWMAIALLLLPPAVVVVTAPINVVIGLIVGPALYLIIFLIAVYTSPIISVASGRFTAGRAQIPTELLATPVVLNAAEHRNALTADFDARAYLCIRGGKIPMVRVPIDDPSDPTPYWLVSTRHPEQLAAAIRASRAEHNAHPHNAKA